MIEPTVPFMGFLVQLEPFNYSSFKIIYHQKLVHEMYQEESNHHEKLSPSINHECTVKIYGVVKISVNKINGPNELLLQKNPSVCSNMIMIKELMYYLGR